MDLGNLITVAVSSIASALSFSFGVAQVLETQYITGVLLLGIGFYLFGWACAKR